MVAPSISTVDVRCTVNNREVTRSIPPHRTLVEFLRDDLELTGTTEGCGVGVCGCCTVLVDGEPINSCLELAVNVDGGSITTIEGLGTPTGLDPVQSGFKTEEGFQCGYCTPGMIMMARSLLDRHPDPDSDTIDHYMAENLCRCTGYESIRSSIEHATELEADSPTE